MTTQFSPELHGQYKAKAYAAANAKSPLVPDQMHKHVGSFDFILDAVSAEHDINAYIVVRSEEQ
jgi:hypothetical protein